MSLLNAIYSNFMMWSTYIDGLLVVCEQVVEALQISFLFSHAQLQQVNFILLLLYCHELFI